MNMNNSGFDKVKRGLKTHGYRLYDRVGRHLKIGDQILIHNAPDYKESVLITIIGIAHYKTFQSLYADYFDVDFKYRYRSVNDILKETYRHWYTKEDEEKYGAMAFKFEITKTYSKL